MKKKLTRLISAILSAAMALTSIPFSAFAEGEVHTHDGESNVIDTSLDFREKTADDSGDGWSWDYGAKTLTLDGVNIQATTDDMSVVTVPDGTEIVLKGENTIIQTDTGDSYTYVLSAVNNEEVNCDGTMTFSGDGVLNAENLSTDSMARSLGGTIIINGGTVNATGKVVAKSLEIHNDGVLNANPSAVSNDGAAVSVERGITVDGNGNLTAVGSAVEDEYAADNGAILLTSNFGDKISVSGNGSITVPESNKARVGIYYCTNTSIDAEISGGKVTAYGTKCGIYKVYLTMSGTGSVYATGGSYGIGQTVPTIDEDEFVVKGSTEFKAEESAVTGNAEFVDGYYKVGEENAKTVVIKPNTEPSIKLGKQIGAIYSDEEGNNSFAYFYITEKNFADGTFNPEVEWVTSTGSANIDARITKVDGNYVCEVICDEPNLTRQYELRVKSGDVYSNTVTVSVGKPHFTLVDEASQSKYYTNYNGEQKITLEYGVDAGYENTDGLQYNWNSSSKKYDIADLGTVTVEDGVATLVFSDNVPEGSYVIYCDVVLSDESGEAYTLTERFAFTFEECKHTGGFTDGICDNCNNPCEHTDIDIDSGKCAACGKVCGAAVIKTGGTVASYETTDIAIAFAEAGKDENKGCTLKLFSDCSFDSDVGLSGEFTLDFNGHALRIGSNNIVINENAVVTVTGKAGSNVNYDVKTGGMLTFAADYDGFTHVTMNGGKLNVYNGNVSTLFINEDSEIKLYGGHFGYMTNLTKTSFALGNLLADGYAFVDKTTNSIVSVYNYILESGGGATDRELNVVKHEACSYDKESATGECKECGKPCLHDGIVDIESGACDICGGAAGVANYTDENGNVNLIETADDLDAILTEYSASGTIKLFKDYSKSSAKYDLYGELTIDVNGHKLSVWSITPCNSGKLTIKNSGDPVTFCCNPSPTNDASYRGGTLIIDGDITLDTAIYVYDSSTVILNAGTYPAGLYARGSKTLYDMLGEGKAFFKADGTLFNANVKEVTTADGALKIDAHPEHTYIDGECGCGYVCPHDEVDTERGKCTKCEYQFAAIITKDGKIISRYEGDEGSNLTLAFFSADSDENKGCTLGIFKEYGNNYHTLNGEFTLTVGNVADIGELNVAGNIKVRSVDGADEFTGTLNVADGGKLTFTSFCRFAGTVTVNEGTFESDYKTFTTKFTLKIKSENSDVILRGGYIQIAEITYEGGGERANADFLTLLTDDSAICDESLKILDASEITLGEGLKNVIIDEHSHNYNAETGKCACGRVCGHADVDADTGMCKTCKHEFLATLTVGDKTTGFDTLEDCFSNTSEDSENYVKIYKDITSDEPCYITAKNKVTLDLNGNRLNNTYIDIDLSNGELTLTGAEGSYVNTVHNYNEFTIDSNANVEFESIVICKNGQFSVHSGANVTVSSLQVCQYKDNSTGTYKTSATLACGMKIGELEYVLNTSAENGSMMFKDLLADNLALKYDESDELVDLYDEFTDRTINNVTVVEHNSHTFSSETGKCACGYTCEHKNVDNETGICGDCGYQLTAGISGVETPSYYGNIDDALAAAVSEEKDNNGCTLTLYKNCELSQIVEIRNRTITVDVNGYSLGGMYAEIDVIDSGVLYLKDSRKSTYNGIINTPVVVNGGTLINGSADGSSSAVDIYNLGVSGAESVEIYGGRCENLYIQNASGIALYGGIYGVISGDENTTPVSTLLAKGYAFVTLNDVTNLPEKIVDGSATMIGGRLENVAVVKHTHTYDETNTKCACGAVLYATVTTADGTVEKFDNIDEGLLYADKAENKGCVFTVVTDGELENNITLSSGQFTITAIDNNKAIKSKPITIDGAYVRVENCIFKDVSVYVNSGTLELPEGSNADFDMGISVSGGTLIVSHDVDEYCGAYNLRISDDATDVNMSIGGGVYTTINLGPYTLKEVLASGTRLISYERSQETDEIIATNELLYSDVSGQNTFNAEDTTYRFVKCDHKNDDGSYALDSGVCKYCNLTFAASVSYTTDDGEKTELFADIFSAFDKANEVGTATVTLQKNIEGELSRVIESTGSDITLDLNGKKLRAIYDSSHTVDVKDGKLTIKGEGQSNYVTVYDGANAEIQGGVFTTLKVEDGGNAELKGGRFGGVSVSGEGRTVEDLLAYGYGYMNFMDVAWVKVANREKQTIANVSVKEAPIKSVSIAWQGEAPAVVYRNGNQSIYLDVTAVSDANKRLLTYSDFVNGNTVSSNRTPANILGIGDYVINLQNNIWSLNTADSSVADGEVEYYCIFKYNGYEYKTNTLKFTLATCSHPEESFTERNEDQVKCGICGIVMQAQVNTADGEMIYRGGMNDAIKIAQENEGSTLVLISGRISAGTVVDSGKFTIDINGTDLCYYFDIQGGEVTFTSPTAHSNPEPSSRLDVSGNDAKVTIDGKVRLGDVYIYEGGTLTINSADAYIKNLSTRGGKIDIDGAQIDSLAFSGGDLAIRNITAGSLNINSKANSASEHNIVIESGSFDTITCSDDSDYNIVKALASERRLRNSNSGSIIEYAEIYSLTEATDITVEKCDHKYANGNIAVDDDYVCYYCHSQIVATVTYTAADGSEKTDLFGDICDAFDKANEVGTATVTLCSDIDGTLTQEIEVSGNNITLDLNGKILRAGEDLSSTIIVLADSGNGRTLTVNGDGSIGRVTVLKAAKIIVNGGNFEYLYIVTNAEAEISGGRFDRIYALGEECDSFLADGYAYKNADEGTWLSIADRKNASLYNVIVEEAPIKSASISRTEGEPPVIYRNSTDSRETIYMQTMLAGNNTSGLDISVYVDDMTDALYTYLSLNGVNTLLLDNSADLRDAVPEDREFKVYFIFECDGYSYKSNTITFRIDTCPHESITENANGTLTCDKCKSNIYASVETADGKKTYHEGLSAAISKAEENDGSILTLLDVVKSGPYKINKGSFTVDFNGKYGSSRAQFININGGNIVFKSSTAMEKYDQLVVRVLKEDADVSIGSGVYLQELIVESGKVTVEDDVKIYDGIGVYGGETVIRSTDTVSGLGNLTLYESETEYNVSIESGYFLSVKCIDGSNYTLGKAIAKGTTVKNDEGRSYKYSDIFDSTDISSAVIIEKCLHFEDNSSNHIALDSSGRCIYCNNEYAATVDYIGSDGMERIDLFENILDAFDKANEEGVATVKLYKDIADSDLTNNEDSGLTRNIIVKGDVTLELNGKNLGDTSSSSRIYIYNGGALTVNGDGRIPVRIYTNPGSKITVNSGYCNYIAADGNVIVRGGTIDLLNIYSEAEISGGTFKFLTINNGGTLESVLVDGNAYYNVDDENWLTVAEREEKAINGKNVTVKEAPIKSARIAWRNGESPVVYRNGMQSFTVDVAKELAGDLQVSYSDFVNGIERTADSVLGVDFTTISGADVEACGISDGEVEYYCIFTCDGYEYKSNVLEFTLATCLHEKLTNVGGIVTCDECGFCLIAQVETADGEVTYYDGIATALAAAAENEGSTLTLVSRIQVGVSVPISGGKFTVDLAGVPAKYKFNITGGDITFKSSEEFSSDYSDRCNITVNGYSAKVTIDGKIELETVELSDGTFTTNSTEAYIEKLSIWDGKATVDGAYIRTIMIYGGNTVIKDVVADSLDMNRYGNISIVSGRFQIVTFFGYTLGKAIASGSRVIGNNMSGAILYKYADIQSMTEASDIIVEKCDHKDKYGNAAVSNNACLYCNSQIVATVTYATADGNVYTDLFADICDAFDKANEKESATVTLLRNRSAELTRAIDVTGNVTLELNGYSLVAGYDMRTITVAEGGKLTVNGGDNDRLYIVYGLPGSKIIVNGGSLTSLYVNGEAELTGGSFSTISCAQGITVDSLLAPGYAYKKSTSGTWVSIADRENTSLSSVTVTGAPVLSGELEADKTKIYRNGAGKVTFDITAKMRDGITVSAEKNLTVQRYVETIISDGPKVGVTASITDEVTDEYLGAFKHTDGESVKVYYIVTYDNGYELRTNTVALEVATCDHPVDKVNSSTGGKLVCGECESIICAEIINGDSIKCYSDFEEAMYDVQFEENEGCTVMVTGDVSGISFITLSSGLFTLDLAGHKVVFIDDRTMTNTGADVTIKDSIGGGIIRSGEGIANVITVQNNGKVTLESGTIANNVYITSGKLDMCGATVDNTVEIGANAQEVTIRDGSVIKGTLYVRAGADPTHIKLSGGWYAYAYVDGSDFAKLLVKDKRLLKDSGGYYSYSELSDSTCKPENFTIVDCDHKEADGSIAHDSDYACKYCGTKFVARVRYTADGATVAEYFESIYEAFDKANTIDDDSLVVDILNNVEGQLDKPLTVTGNITLDHDNNSGIFAVSDDGRSITVADGGILKLTGRDCHIENIFVEYGGQLYVNGGTYGSVTSYGYTKLYAGTFGKLKTDAIGGVSALLSGECGYKNANGEWLTVAEREADSAENVTVDFVPLYGITLITDTEKLYRNSNNETTVKFDISINAAANVFDGTTNVQLNSQYFVNSNEVQSKKWTLSDPNYNDTLNSSEILTLADGSDVAEIYCIVTYDGYEVKTNTVCIDLVDCEHPSASIVDPITDEDTNGNITNPTYCEICKTQFHAKIVNGDSVKYYNDLYEAVADAQKSENEGCTLYPLYDANGYKEQIVISGGKFTFRVLARVYISKPVIIKGDADITILGRALVSKGADNTAVIVESGNVDFAGLATSDVIINGGNVTMSAINVRHLAINGGNVSIASGQFSQIDVTTEGKVIADYIVPGNWVQDGKTNEWIDIYHLTSATETAESIGLRVRMCPMLITQPEDAVYYTNGYYPNGIPSLEVDAMAQYTAEVNPAIAYQWFSVDENGNETAIEGATDKTLSLANLTTGRYYCRITYSNATTAGVSVKSDIVTATITECKHTGGEADCTNKAVCEICHAEYGDLLPHNYELRKEAQYLKSPADCTNAAVYYLACTICGKSSELIDPNVTQAVGDPLGHDYGEWVSNGDGTHTRVCANDSTHTETDNCHGGTATCTAKAKCEVCGAEYGEMTAHTFTAKTTTTKYLKTAATCTTKAVYYTSCADCGLSSKGTKNEATFEYGNVLGHKYGAWVSNGDGTHTRVCANDNAHTETDNCHGGTATCTAKAICEDCGKAYGEMTAHSFTAKSAVSRYLKIAATCTQKSEYYVSCAVCRLSSKGTASEAVFSGSALGHSLTEWNVTAAATCTADGTQERHCTRCDYKQTKSIAAKGHQFGSWTITKKVSCLEDGEQSRVCSVCKKKEVKTIAATGVHIFGEWKVTKAATCTTTGVKERTCTGCGAKTKITLQATGHKYVTSTVKPTYTSKGYTLHKCSVCGNSYKSNYTAVLVLAQVSGLKRTARTNTTVTLSWNRNSAADGYIVERYDGKTWVRIAKISGNGTTSYTVKSLAPSTTNRFRVKAYKSTANSAYSYVTVNTLPNAVTGFKVTSKTSTTATLSWNKNSSAGGYIIEYYNGTKWVQSVKISGNSTVKATVKGIAAGKSNKLRIKAYKVIGSNTVYSAYTQLTVKTKPTDVTGLKVAGKTNNTVKLQWNKNTSADSYIIEKYSGNKWVQVTKISGNATTSYTVSGLKSGTTYKLRIKAAKSGEYSNCTYINVTTKPYAVNAFKTKSVSKSAITLQWNKNTSADGYCIEKYNGTKWVQVKRYASNASTTYTIKSLKAGTTYKFRIRAYKTLGNTAEYSTYTYCNVTTKK